MEITLIDSKISEDLKAVLDQQKYFEEHRLQEMQSKMGVPTSMLTVDRNGSNMKRIVSMVYEANLFRAIPHLERSNYKALSYLRKNKYS